MPVDKYKTIRAVLVKMLDKDEINRPTSREVLLKLETICKVIYLSK